MMEFVSSRAALIVCGAILMGSVLVPVSGILEDDEYDLVQSLAEKDASVIDHLFDSNLHVITIDGSDMLPSPSYRMVLEGHDLVITDGDSRLYIAYLAHVSERIEIGYSDSVELVRSPEGSITTRTSPPPS
ncbi:hypothetical protein TALC_01001 [Thermoplasmatales archaeon BRNA1]|nr:hypothetical protein TALC_01001 [Thermoplasmatales archaeon BRNA1]